MNLKSRFFLVFAVAAMSVGAASAGEVNVVFDTPDQTASAGATLQYFGTITNTTDGTIFLNSDDLSMSATAGDFTLTDQFFNTVPISLGAGQSSGDIELFDVTITAPFPDNLGTYYGSYTLLGGVDGNASDVLTTPSVEFSTTVTPEPVTSVLLLAGLGGIAVWRRRTNSQSA